MLLLLLLGLISLALASNPQAGLLGASRSFEDAFVDLLPNEPLDSQAASLTPRLVIYVQTFTNTAGRPLSLLPLLEHDTKVTHVILGSIHLHEQPGVIMLNNEPLDSGIYDEIWKEVRILQDHNIKVLALLGGAAPGTYARLSGNDTQFELYYRPFLKLLKTYRLDGVDVDIEEKVPLSTPLRLLKRLHADLGSEFLLTMAPLATALSEEGGDNLSGFSYFQLEKLAVVPAQALLPQVQASGDNETAKATSLVAWYNAQFYGGYARSPSMYNSIVSAGFDPSRLVLGVTTSSAGYPNGFTPLKKLLETVTALKEKFGERFGGVSGWEYWDAGSSDKDMGMQIGGEPWRWLIRVGKAIYGEEEQIRGRGRKSSSFNKECWRKCISGKS